MAYGSYNGWSGLVRKARDAVFFGAIKSGDLPDPRIYVQHPKKGLIERKYMEAEGYKLSRYLELKTGYMGDRKD
jgi:hypothetical protein